MKVPRSFKRVRWGSTVAIVREDLSARLDILGPDGAAERLEPTRLEGRGVIGAVPDLSIDGSRVLVRHARRGGLAGRILPGAFFGRCRAFRELAVANMACSRDVPTAEVVAAVRRRVFGPFHRGSVYTKELTGTADLLSYLASAAGHRHARSLERKRDTLREAGRLVRTAHDAGLYHADLQLKNLLVRDDDKPEVFLIDLDKARLQRPLSNRRRTMNLLRLRRSAAKAVRSGACITRSDMLRFLIGYTGADARALLRAYWRAPLLKPIYRAKWALSDVLYSAAREGPRRRHE